MVSVTFRYMHLVLMVNHQINSLIEKCMLSHSHLGRSEDERAEMDRSDDISKVVAGGARLNQNPTICNHCWETQERQSRRQEAGWSNTR
jgi:hypothetical protein